MRADLEALATFDRLARVGAQGSAGALEQVVRTRVDVRETTAEFPDPAGAEEAAAADSVVGVVVGLAGDLSGRATLALDCDGATHLVETVQQAGAVTDREPTVEMIAARLLAGFLEEWAGALGVHLDRTAPEGVAGPAALARPTDPSDDEVTSYLRVRIGLEVGTAAIDAIATIASVDDALERIAGPHRSESAVPVDAVPRFRELVATGAATAAVDLEALTGVEMATDGFDLQFGRGDALRQWVESGIRVGTAVQLIGLVRGYALVLFDEQSAQSVATRALPASVDEDRARTGRRSAIKEIGNVTTSAFVDGWANAVNKTIDLNPPEYVRGRVRDLVDTAAGRLERTRSFLPLVRAEIGATEGVSCDLYVIADDRSFAQTLRRLASTPAAVDGGRPVVTARRDGTHEEL